MNRTEFVGLAAAINLSGIHEANDGQRKTRIDAAVNMANALAEALGMGPGPKGEGAAPPAIPAPSLPPGPAETFGEGTASVPPTPGQMHPERAIKHDEPTKHEPAPVVAPPRPPVSHEHERIQPEHPVPKHDEPSTRKTGR